MKNSLFFSAIEQMQADELIE